MWMNRVSDMDDSKPSAQARRIAALHMARISQPRHKTAGEVRFIKDDGVREPKRLLPDDYNYDAKALKPMAKTLLSLTMSLGHLLGAHSRFTKIKSRSISPDGKLGGKGYIQDVNKMRQSLSEAIELLSATIDTLDDEIKAPHWSPERHLNVKDQKEVADLIDKSEDVRADPEAFDNENLND